MRRNDEPLMALLASQHGVVSRQQLRPLYTPGQRRHAVARWLDPVTGSAFRLRGSNESPLQRALAAVLDAGPGAVLSHHSAAALWDLPGFLLEPHHVSQHRPLLDRTDPYLGQIHRPRKSPPTHTTVLDGIPVTTPSRIILDLANVGVHPLRVERTLDAAWAQGLLDQAGLTTALRDLARQGRTGVRLVRKPVEERDRNYRPPESGLEFRFRQLLRDAGLPEFERQVNVGDESNWLGRVDFVDRERRVIVQIDSERYHSALIDKVADSRQTAQLEAAGWIVIRVTDVDVWHRPTEVIARVRRALSFHPKAA